MKKFSRLVESKTDESDFLKKLNISHEDLEEIFIDLSDMGYSMSLEDVYISTSTGYPHRRSSETKEFYPGLEIDLHRETDDRNGKSLSKFDDVRKWNGGIYYEDDIHVLESITNVIHRLESMFENKSTVYYSLRSLNELSIRVMFEVAQNDEAIDYEQVKGYIDDLQAEPRHNAIFSTLDGDRIDYYRLFRHWSSGNNYTTEIHPIKNERGARVNINNPVNSADFIIKDIIENGKTDNKYQLNSIFDTYVKKLYRNANSLYRLELVKLKDSEYGEPSYNIVDKDSKSKLVEIRSSYEDFAPNVNVLLQKGLFQKDKVAKVNIYYMEIKIKLVKSSS